MALDLQPLLLENVGLAGGFRLGGELSYAWTFTEYTGAQNSDSGPTVYYSALTEQPVDIRASRVRGGETNTITLSEPGSALDRADRPHWLVGLRTPESSVTAAHTARVVDELCIIRSLHTEAINHDPAMTFLQTGSQQSGRPALGSWLSYGLGTENQNLPAFIVMISRPSGPTNAQPLHERMWSAGFLPSIHQGARFSPGKDPVLFLSNPPGITSERRRAMLDDLAQLNRMKFNDYQDPEIQTRIAQYELAYRMQASVPELTDLSHEPKSTFELYGPESTKPGTYAANCILARRLVERGVRFIQLYHRGWDQHDKLPEGIKSQCYDTDQPTAVLITELRQRGLLDDTLVIWGGEFGRTVFS